jgi:hypothetical protein
VGCCSRLPQVREELGASQAVVSEWRARAERLERDQASLMVGRRAGRRQGPENEQDAVMEQAKQCRAHAAVAWVGLWCAPVRVSSHRRADRMSQCGGDA